MIKNFTEVITGILFFIFFPILALASSYTSAETTIILNSYTLFSATIVGAVTSLLVFTYSRKMKGGLMGTVLFYFSVAMFALLVVFISSALPLDRTSENVELKVIHDILFIGSYLLMAFASKKLSVVIK